MVVRETDTKRLLEKTAQIYSRLDSEIHNPSSFVGQCKACGACCDFARFEHRLFVTTPEMIYLAENLGCKNLKPMPSARCPYNRDGKCLVYAHRFAGCRIFRCSGDSDFQSRLSESVLKKLKVLCDEFRIPYRYTDLASALNGYIGR